MQHRNISSHSLNENLFDIAISGKTHRSGSNSAHGDRSMAKKKTIPRRVGLLTSLSSASEQKRPGEYYLNRLAHIPAPNSASNSALNNSASTTPHAVFPASKSGARSRPGSSVSVVSSDASKDSDDAMLVVSTPFDVVDSRLSSMTNYSTYSTTKPGDSPIVAPAKGQDYLPQQAATPAEAEMLHDNGDAALDESMDQLSLSLSTITLPHLVSSIHSVAASTYESAIELLDAAPPKLRAASTSSVVEMRRHLSTRSQLPPLSRQASVSSSFMLTRSKTRYYNPKETKERKQLRKKLYEENDVDDELLTNDLDLVFNVPVIKNHGELYRTRRTESVPNMVLSRKDIVTNDDNKYPYKPTESMRPCPLPGKLSRSNLSVDRIPQAIPELQPLGRNEDIPEEGYFQSRNGSGASVENDSEICNNISDFYTQRSLSYSALAKATRDHQLTDRLPSFVKSQCSVEDLSLVSPEKLELIDQSRPINLPPKLTLDKSKHNRHLHKVFTDFEASSKKASSMRENLGLLMIANQQSWLKWMLTSSDKDFDRKLNSGRDKLRKLNWESLAPSRFRFDYYMKVLLLNQGEEFATNMKKTVAGLDAKIAHLAPQMKAAKDAEFNSIIGEVLQRPLFKNFIAQVKETRNAEFDQNTFRANFRQILYLKSFSEGGLKKHHQIFVIPVFLMMFQNEEALSDIFTLIELFDREILNTETLSLINSKLSCWSDLSKMSSSSQTYKILKTFNSLQEFEQLSATSLFEVIIQLNDRLPLSLSAPSTPVVAHGAFRAFPKTSSESESGPKDESANPLDETSEEDSENVYTSSSSLSLVGIFLQLLVTYTRSKNSKHKVANLFQGFMLTVFQFYHINWNSCVELVQQNKSIKLNNSCDQLMNLDSFLEKWKDIYKKL